jgi:hypothetical protein
MITFVKNNQETKIPIPKKWIGQTLNNNLVLQELKNNHLIDDGDFITIDVWRSFNDNNLIIRDNDRIFAVFNLRNNNEHFFI